MRGADSGQRVANTRNISIHPYEAGVGQQPIRVSSVTAYVHKREEVSRGSFASAMP